MKAKVEEEPAERSRLNLSACNCLTATASAVGSPQRGGSKKPYVVTPSLQQEPALARTTDQATIGVLMLDTGFPRFLNDIGNPLSWPCQVIYHVMHQTFAKEVVLDRDDSTIPILTQAANTLIERGASIITTSCGFLVRYQKELSEALSVPFYSSSLLLVELLSAKLSDKGRLMILTISKESLSRLDFSAICTDASNVDVIGMPSDGHFYTTIMGNFKDLDYERVCSEVLCVLEKELKQHPSTEILLLECTNLAPYAGAIRQRFNLPIFSLLDGVMSALNEHNRL